MRILYRTNQTSTSPTTIRYMDTGPLGLLHTYVALVENYDMMSPNQTKMPFSMTGSFAAALMQDIETALECIARDMNQKISDTFSVQMYSARDSAPSGRPDIPQLDGSDDFDFLCCCCCCYSFLLARTRRRRRRGGKRQRRFWNLWKWAPFSEQFNRSIHLSVAVAIAVTALPASCFDIGRQTGRSSDDFVRADLCIWQCHPSSESRR